MKKQVYGLVATLILVGSLGLAAKAQAQGGRTVRANIPFNFNVGDKTLPAGEYVIRQINPNSDAGVLQISTLSGNESRLVRTRVVDVATSGKSVVAFNHYGSQYFLATLAIEGSGYSWNAPKSRGERGIEGELADLKTRRELIEVAAH